MNVVIYARFSSHNQNEQSIEGQLKECYEFAKRNGYTVIGEYIDRAISGTTDNRPEFQRMIADSAKKYFNFVIVYQLDRFARNRYDSATYKNKLKKNSVRVLSARENISDDASGILMEAVLEGMAEYYSKELAQKIKRGMDINAKKCLCTGGSIALGYKVINKHFVIDENTATIVMKIFQMYATGSMMAAIIRHLNEQGIKTSQGNEFNKNSIHRILTNKRYVGIYTYKGTETADGIPGIVPDTLFHEVQEMIQKKKKAPARAKANVDYILTTKLFCGHCKAAMIGISGTSSNGSKYYYYQCINNRKKECSKKTVSKEYIEDRIIKEIRKVLTKENIEIMTERIVARAEKERNSENLKHLQKFLRENEKETENLLKSLKKVPDIADVIAGELKKMKSERENIKTQIAIEQSIRPIFTVPIVKAFMQRFKNGDINDIEYRKALVNTFVNKIFLYDDKMTILCNAQDSQIDLTFDESSPGVTLVEARGVEPLSEKHLPKLSTSVSNDLFSQTYKFIRNLIDPVSSGS